MRSNECVQEILTIDIDTDVTKDDHNTKEWIYISIRLCRKCPYASSKTNSRFSAVKFIKGEPLIIFRRQFLSHCPDAEELKMI